MNSPDPAKIREQIQQEVLYLQNREQTLKKMVQQIGLEIERRIGKLQLMEELYGPAQANTEDKQNGTPPEDSSLLEKSSAGVRPADNH